MVEYLEQLTTWYTLHSTSLSMFRRCAQDCNTVGQLPHWTSPPTSLGTSVISLWVFHPSELPPGDDVTACLRSIISASWVLLQTTEQAQSSPSLPECKAQKTPLCSVKIALHPNSSILPTTSLHTPELW